MNSSNAVEMIPGSLTSMKSTKVRADFSKVLDRVALQGETLVISRGNRTEVVMMSMENYQELVRRREAELSVLRHQFNSMLEQITAPGAAQSAAEAVMSSTPKELGRAAKRAAHMNRTRAANG